MKLTENFKLRKPENTDPVDVADLNENADIIDKELKDRIKANSAASDMTVAFTEAKELTELPSNSTLKSLFGTLALTVKNVKELVKMLGKTDISKLGDGTVTGAISTVNSNLDSKAYSNHTHKYASSSTVGGSADSALCSERSYYLGDDRADKCNLAHIRNSNTSDYYNGEIFFQNTANYVNIGINGKGNVGVNRAQTAIQLASDRTFTIGKSGKSFNGTSSVSWSLAEIGAASTTDGYSPYFFSVPLAFTNGIATYSLSPTYSYLRIALSQLNAYNGQIVVATEVTSLKQVLVYVRSNVDNTALTGNLGVNILVFRK